MESTFHKNEKNLYKGLLQDSDNGIAESLLLMISKKQKNVFSTRKQLLKYLMNDGRIGCLIN